MPDQDDLAAYDRASRRLLGLIRGERAGTMSRSDRFGRAAARLAQTRALLQTFGNPQHGFPIVHVTGTSGKGSVAAMIAAILSAAGYRVGLRTSPYLQVATEKLQVGSLLIDAQSLDRISGQVTEAHERLMPGSRLGYAEGWTALAFLWFAEKKVDLAVVEVGSGGRFDATNVFDPAVSVITSVGLDHTASLGPTLADIAWHKAGIIKPGTTAVVGAVPEEAWTVIQREARGVGAHVVRAGSLSQEFCGPIGMSGAFQIANAEVAIAAVQALCSRGIGAPEDAILRGLAGARLPGRLERMPSTLEPAVWLDGAHNADKMAALAREISLVSSGGSPPVVVLGILKSKNAAAIAAGIAPLATAIIATEPIVVGRTPLLASELAAAVVAAGFTGRVFAVPDPQSALQHAEMLAHAYDANVVVTGSMYLAGQLRGRWYPDEEIVLQRTSWPAPLVAAAQALPERSVAL